MADQAVFAIDATNTFLHVATESQFLTHTGITKENPETERLNKFELYNSNRQRLRVEILDNGEPKFRIVPEEDLIDERLLRDRINAALANIQVRIHDSQEPTFRVPGVDGPLPVVAAALVVAYGPLPNPNARIEGDHRDTLHNASHP